MWKLLLAEQFRLKVKINNRLKYEAIPIQFPKNQLLIY